MLPLSLFLVRGKDDTDHIVVARDADEAEDLAIEDPDQAAKEVREIDHTTAEKLIVRGKGGDRDRSALSILLETHSSQVIATTEE